MFGIFPDLFSPLSMRGVKYKVAHKRPHWRGRSTDYPDHGPERAMLARPPEEELAKVRGEKATGRSVSSF